LVEEGYELDRQWKEHGEEGHLFSDRLPKFSISERNRTPENFV